MAKRRKHIYIRLSSTILNRVNILFVLTLLFVAIYSHILISKEAIKSAENTIHAYSAEIETLLTGVESTIAGAAWGVSEYYSDTTLYYNFTHQLVEISHNIIGSAIAFRPNYYPDKYYFSPYSSLNSSTGLIETKQLGNKDYDYFNMEWFAKPFNQKKNCWSEPYFDEGGADQLMSTFSYPIFDKDSNVLAIMTADIALDWVSGMMRNICPYENSNAFLVSPQGNFLGESNDEYKKFGNIYDMGESLKQSGFDTVVDVMMKNAEGVVQCKFEDETSFVVYNTLNNGWKLYVTCRYDDVLATNVRMHLTLALVGFIGLIVLYFVIRRHIRNMLIPLTELSTSANNMGRGNFKARIYEVESNDEIKDLQNSFLYLQDSLNDYITELKTTTASNERMEGELNIARGIQMGMLQHTFPDNIAALLTPAKEVGGDLYDFYRKDNYLYIAVGDVSGKGVPAALYMAITRAAFRFMARQGLDVLSLMSSINESLSVGNNSNMFCTLFVARIDLATGVMEYCNGGHNPIIVIPPSASGEKPYYLKAKPNLATGLFADFPYQKEQLQLAPSTRLLLYTDGVSEAETRQKELYGEERLLKITQKLATADIKPQAFVDAVYDDVKTFVQSNDPNDDITLMLVDYNPQLYNAQ